MIRIQEVTGWTLVAHADHARLAGEFARHWHNEEFFPPQPATDIFVAVSRHDDAWTERDAQPFLGKGGKPAAFSHELVGTYSAFEDIDLADYLRVRGRATEAVAKDNPYAAIIVSMHTVDLLTAQADLSKLSAADLKLHGEFVAGQRQRQKDLAAQLTAQGRGDDVTPEKLQRAFEFLQACDSLSLTVCVRYPKPITLRHKHPTRSAGLTTILCEPLGRDTYRLTPSPFAEKEVSFRVPCRVLPGATFPTQDALRSTWNKTAPQTMVVTFVR